MHKLEDISKYDTETQAFFASLPELAIDLIIQEQVITPLKDGKPLEDIVADIEATDIPDGAKEFFVKVTEEAHSRLENDSNFDGFKDKEYAEKLLEHIKEMLPPPPPPIDKNAIVKEVLGKIPPQKPNAPIDYNLIIRTVLEMLPPPQHGDNGSPDTPEEIAFKVNKLNAAIEPRAIAGLIGLFELVDKLRKNGIGMRQGGGVNMFLQLSDTPKNYKNRAGEALVVNSREDGITFAEIIATDNFVDDETPNGTVNGVNVNFTLDNTPSPVSSLQLFMNGQMLTRGTDYTISGNAIVFVSAPIIGVILQAYYRK